MTKLALSLYACLLVSVPKVSLATQVQEFVLDNGLKVVLLENHKSPAVTFQVWYRVGSRDEKDGKSGLSHFLEHMMFKGTSRVGPEEYSRLIAKNGGRANAFTTSDVTVYYATMSRDKIGIQIDLEADRMANALLGERYFEPEKKVIQEERRLRTERHRVELAVEARRDVGAVLLLVELGVDADLFEVLEGELHRVDQAPVVVSSRIGPTVLA
jgi:zinc protease